MKNKRRFILFSNTIIPIDSIGNVHRYAKFDGLHGVKIDFSDEKTIRTSSVEHKDPKIIDEEFARLELILVTDQ